MENDLISENKNSKIVKLSIGRSESPAQVTKNQTDDTTKNEIYSDTSDDLFFDGNDGKSHGTSFKGERTIIPDLKDYPFTDDIKGEADVIFNKMHYRVRRGKIRTQLVFYCVYCAYIELDINVNPVQLGRIFGLSPGDVQKCDSKFSPLQTGYRPRSTFTSPLKYLPDYCKQLELTEDAVLEITQLATDLLRKEAALFQENPQTVAAGILKYYTETYGISNDDPQKIAKVTGRSNVTIDGIYRRIATIDNSQ
jgi:hypothetical protein